MSYEKQLFADSQTFPFRVMHWAGAFVAQFATLQDAADYIRQSPDPRQYAQYIHECTWSDDGEILADRSIPLSQIWKPA